MVAKRILNFKMTALFVALCIILGILEDLSYAHKAGDPFWYL